MEPRARILPDGRAVAGGMQGAVAAGLSLAMLRRVRAMCVAVSAVSS